MIQRLHLGSPGVADSLRTYHDNGTLRQWASWSTECGALVGFALYPEGDTAGVFSPNLRWNRHPNRTPMDRQTLDGKCQPVGPGVRWDSSGIRIDSVFYEAGRPTSRTWFTLGEGKAYLRETIDENGLTVHVENFDPRTGKAVYSGPADGEVAGFRNDGIPVLQTWHRGILIKSVPSRSGNP
ncbi:MAG: hypothetical protein H6686_02700 [Fibrobacteria bacterium]|nr:hypothetical protein [Fibrobacteria bacterium]